MCDMNMYDQKIKKKQLLSINGFCYNKKALHRNRFNFFDPPPSETETCAAHLFY